MPNTSPLQQIKNIEDSKLVEAINAYLQKVKEDSQSFTSKKS